MSSVFQGLQERQDMPPIRPREKYIPKVRTKQSPQSLKNHSLGTVEQSATEAKQCCVHNFRSATARLSKAEIEVITRNSEAEQYYCSGDFITVQLISAQKLIVCDAVNKRVRFFSPDGTIFRTTGAGRLYMPFVCHERKVLFLIAKRICE